MSTCAICRDPLTPGSDVVLSDEILGRLYRCLGRRRAHQACLAAAERTLRGQHRACHIEPTRTDGILDLRIEIF